LIKISNEDFTPIQSSLLLGELILGACYWVAIHYFATIKLPQLIILPILQDLLDQIFSLPPAPKETPKYTPVHLPLAPPTMSGLTTEKKYFRVKFDDGYIFRMHASDLTELKQKVASHYWWGQQKPPNSLCELTLKRHHRKKNLVHYTATAQGYPIMPDKDENASDF
jgi:hypothetical protein